MKTLNQNQIDKLRNLLLEFEEENKIQINEQKVLQWEDLPDFSGWWIDTNSHVDSVDRVTSSKENRNIYPTKEEANAALALCQLLRWRDIYNEGWKPDWTNDETKWGIVFKANIPGIHIFINFSIPLYFKSEEIANKFLKEREDLILTARPLL